MEIHIARDGQQFGPFSPEDVRRQLAAGTLLPTDFAWSEGATAWVPLGSLPTLSTPTPRPVASPLSPMSHRVAAQAVAVTAVAVAPRAVRTSGAAVASMTLGLLSLTLLPVVAGLPGVICGHIARGGIRRSGGTLAGLGMATAGLITSYIGLFFSLLIIVFAVATILAGKALPFIGEAQMRGKQTLSIVQAKQIGVACRLYATDHAGKFPKTLEELVPKYLPNQQLFICPLSGPGVPMGYQYFGGTDQDPGDKILLMSIFQDPTGKRVVVHSDCSAMFQQPAPNLLPPGGR